jgi:hypothetical protein
VNHYLFYINELYGFSIVRPLQSAIISRGDKVAWFLEDKDRLEKYLRPYEEHLRTVKEVQEYNPRAIFVPGNLVPDFFPGLKVEIFHGFHVQKRKNTRGHFRIRNFFDLYCTQGPHTTKPFLELSQRHGSFEIVETGWPKMDPLFWETQEPELAKERPIILFTSTFTPRLSAAPVLFKQIQIMAKKGNWKWLINFHPKMSKDIVAMYKSIQNENLALIETDDIIPLLKAADCMVSDTTSVIAEFILLNKPVVTFKNRVPSPYMLNIKDPSKIEKALAYALSYPPDLMNEIKSYTALVHPYRDGRSSERVLAATDLLIQKGTSHLKPKPLNLFRKIKIRKKLGYYHV